MFDAQVVPLVRSTFSDRLPPLALQAFYFYGIGEGDLANSVDPLLLGVAGLDVGYCAHSTGIMELRLLGAPDVVAQGVGHVRPHLGPECFSESSASLEGRIVTLLAEKGQTVTVAESCTGGAVLSRITDVPGASAVLDRGFVVYANRAKSDLISVSESDLREFGAVSETVARQMAEGALAAAGANHALALTGVAGPDGGTERTPVGTVWIALASRGLPTLAVRERWLTDRPTFKLYAGSKALDLLRRRLDGSEGR